MSAWATILPSGRRSARAIRFLLIRKNTSTGTNAAACDTAREKEQTAALSVLLAALGQNIPKGRAKSFDL